MANHPLAVGDRVLIRAHVYDTTPHPSTVRFCADSDGSLFYATPAAVTIHTQAEPGDKSVVIDRHGFSWQRISGEWCQGDVCHTWQYLTEHAGPVKIIHRGGEDG